MTEKESRRVKTLSSFIKWAAQFNDGRYLFRGVPKDSYRMEASAYRRLKTNKTADWLLKVNQELIKGARARGHDWKNGQELSDLELLAELQHFGAATCLIDFSRNALVALWFACQQSSKGKANGKVFAVPDKIRLKEVTPDLIKKEGIDHFFRLDKHGKYPLYKWEPKLQNNRIIAQHSVFVFGRAQIDVEAECVIIQSSKQEILNSLDQLLDITESSMYPDFDGFARLHAHDQPYIEPDARDYFRRGIEAHQREELDDAIDYYTLVIELDSDLNLVTEAYTNRGVAYHSKDDYELAIRDHNKAVDLNPNYAEAYFNRGGAYKSKGDYDRAIADFTKAADLKPNFAGVYNHRGVVYLDKGDYDCAIADFTTAIDLNPDFVDEAYYNRGLAYHKKGEIDKALKDYTKAIDLNPKFVDEVYYNRGRVWLYLREWEKAKSDLTAAMDREMDIITAFTNDYTSVPDFERRNGVKLPPDIAAMLTPQQ